jgi:hypothetical protein
MKTMIDLPDPLFRRASILAAREGTTLSALVVEGLQCVTGGGPTATGSLPVLTVEESAVAAIGAHGLPVLKRPAGAKKPKVPRALVDRIRDELAL